MENLSKDARRHTMRKGYDNDCRTAMTWAPEGRRRRSRPRTTWRTAENKERAERRS